MKTHILLSLIILLILPCRSNGQSTYIDRYSLKTSSFDFKKTLKCEIESGDIEVYGIAGDSIKIEAEVYNAPGKNYTCSENECMTVDEDFFHFSVKPREGEKIKRIVVRSPFKTSISIRIWKKGSVTVNKIYGEIQINTMRMNDISLKQVIGPLSLSGTYGNIDVEFDKGISKKIMAVTLLKGNINIIIPKGEKVTIASSCPDEKSSIKDYPIKFNGSIKLKKDTSEYSWNQLGKMKLSINVDYKERIETREYFGFANKKPIKLKNKSMSFNEDVWVYDINGGGSNIELKVYQGSIQIKELK